MSIFLIYFYWHYFERPKDIFAVVSAYVNFWVFFFSANRVFKSLFTPWKKIEATMDKNGFDIAVWANVVFFNVISRVMGFVMRLILLCVFLFFEFLTLTLGILFIVFWLFLPLILGYVIIYGFLNINV